MELGLQGKRAIVLAASRGLGYACALGLAREGCSLIICSREATQIEAAAEKIRNETNAEIYPIEADVSNRQDIERVVELASNKLGGVEVLIHNAGGPPAGAFTEVPADEWEKSFALNLMSFVWLVRAALPELKKAGYGRIIAITSSSIRQPIPNLVLSNTMRPGVYGLAKSLSKELAPSNILVNVIVPGRVLTERIAELDEAAARKSGKSLDAVRQATISSIPVGRLGRPEEVANVAVFLASEAASYINGAAIHVDGGKIDSL